MSQEVRNAREVNVRLDNGKVVKLMCADKKVICPWCLSDEVSARTVTDMVSEDGSRTVKDLCRCSECSRTFTIPRRG